MLSNRQKIYNIVSADLRDREFSRRNLLDLIDKHYSGTNHESILPSDYLRSDAVKGDPSNDGNRGNYTIYPRFLERLGRDRYRFVGWDGIDQGSIDTPGERNTTADQPARSPTQHDTSRAATVVFVSERDGRTDNDRIVVALRRLTPSVRPSSDRAWRRESALRVIDCVLSLNRRYDSFVVPRLDRFEREHPGIRTVSDLQGLIANYSSPGRFVAEVLDYRDEPRAATLRAVVDWLATVSGSGTYAEQLSNLQRWVAKAHPAGHAALRISGFGLGGFQYLRMLFGANTTKPDVHICRYVASCVGHSVSAVEALQLLEHAAVETGIFLRDLDTTIWEASARRSS